MSSLIAEINECKYLFLTDIQELGYNSLKLIVAEGLPGEELDGIKVGDVSISGGTRIEITDQSRIFELTWTHYIVYAVFNEGYVSVDESEQYEGSRFRIYSKSKFLDYVSQATFASDEYPGPTHHYCVACEDHVIQILTTDFPLVNQLQ